MLEQSPATLIFKEAALHRLYQESMEKHAFLEYVYEGLDLAHVYLHEMDAKGLTKTASIDVASVIGYIHALEELEKAAQSGNMELADELIEQVDELEKQAVIAGMLMGGSKLLGGVGKALGWRGAQRGAARMAGGASKQYSARATAAGHKATIAREANTAHAGLAAATKADKTQAAAKALTAKATAASTQQARLGVGSMGQQSTRVKEVFRPSQWRKPPAPKPTVSTAPPPKPFDPKARQTFPAQKTPAPSPKPPAAGPMTARQQRIAAIRTKRGLRTSGHSGVNRPLPVWQGGTGGQSQLRNVAKIRGGASKGPAVTGGGRPAAPPAEAGGGWWSNLKTRFGGGGVEGAAAPRLGWKSKALLGTGLVGAGGMGGAFLATPKRDVYTGLPAKYAMAQIRKRANVGSLSAMTPSMRPPAVGGPSQGMMSGPASGMAPPTPASPGGAGGGRTKMAYEQLVQVNEYEKIAGVLMAGEAAASQVLRGL